MRKKFTHQIDEFLKTSLKAGENFDVNRREVGTGKKSGVIYFLNSLCDDTQISFLLLSLNNAKNARELEQSLFNGPVQRETNSEKILTAVESGLACLLIDNFDEALIIELRSYPNRSISEPQSEKAIRGSKDGFNENIQTNVALIRRRVRCRDLTIKMKQVGTKSRTDVAMLYLNTVARQDVVATLSQRIDEIDVDSLIMTDRALEELVFTTQKNNLFPLVRYTERPDIAAIHLMQGKIVIIVDNSSSVILTPTTLSDHTKHVQEFRQSKLTGTFTRMLRLFAIFISVFLVPLWVGLITDNVTDNLFILSPSKEIGMPLLLQVLISTLLVEILRIAIVHTPNELTSAIGLIAAIILGEVALNLNIFLPETLIYVSLSAICNFATPSYELSLANKITSIIMIIFASIFGRVGFILSTTFFFLYLVSIKVWGVPYLYPLLPFDEKKALNVFIRQSADERKVL